MLLGGEEWLRCEVCLNGIRLEHVSEFKYFGCVLDESGKDEAECSESRAPGAIRSLVYTMSLQVECARVLHESLLVPFLRYGSETMIWREKRGLGLGLYRWTISEV